MSVTSRSRPFTGTDAHNVPKTIAAHEEEIYKRIKAEDFKPHAENIVSAVPTTQPNNSVTRGALRANK